MKNPDNALWFLRVHNGLTQNELRKMTGLTNNDISRFERGRYGIQIGKTIKLANYFGVTLDALIDNDFPQIITGLKTPPIIRHRMLKSIKVKRKLSDRIGLEGESWVYRQEVEKLSGTGYEYAVNPNFADDDEAHFDLLSFDKDTGEKILIEVKATIADKDDDFHITAAELELAKECRNNGIRYEVHRVYFVEDTRKRGRTIYSAADLLDGFEFRPCDYVAIKKVA